MTNEYMRRVLSSDFGEDDLERSFGPVTRLLELGETDVTGWELAKREAQAIADNPSYGDSRRYRALENALDPDAVTRDEERAQRIGASMIGQVVGKLHRALSGRVPDASDASGPWVIDAHGVTRRLDLDHDLDTFQRLAYRRTAALPSGFRRVTGTALAKMVAKEEAERATQPERIHPL